MKKSPFSRKIIFLTGTRADFGKQKSLMLRMQSDDRFDVQIFITGMHTLSKYGSTWDEVRKAGLKNIYRFINQNDSDSMDQVLAKTIAGFSDYVKETVPDMIVVHGDRLEALAGATVGAFNNIRVAHIEGGEVSGTVDELIRHSVSKMSNLHFVSNDSAKKRLIQLGEEDSSIHVIGSPDIDVMESADLPTIDEVKLYYQINFNRYAILLFHPVTTEVHQIRHQTAILVDSLIATQQKFIVIYPNNDHGNKYIFDEYERLRNNPHFLIYPSMRFEYFLTLLKHSDYIIGNSSAGVREAPHFGVPTINLGTRQNNRVFAPSIMNVQIDRDKIIEAINQVMFIDRIPRKLFGDGNSSSMFYEILTRNETWYGNTQKFFIDYKET